MPFDATPNPLNLTPKTLGIMYDLVSWLESPDTDFDYGTWETCIGGRLCESYPDKGFHDAPSQLAMALGIPRDEVAGMICDGPPNVSARKAADYVRTLLETGSARW